MTARKRKTAKERKAARQATNAKYYDRYALDLMFVHIFTVESCSNHEKINAKRRRKYLKDLSHMVNDDPKE